MTDHSRPPDDEPRMTGAAAGRDALDCIEVVELVTDYLEGTLPAADRERLERHLATCTGCTAYVEQMRETVRAAGHLEPESVPPEAMDQLLEVYRSFRRT